MQASEHYRISSLEIENFRQYRHAYIEFSREPGKAFTILRGANGAGKTNIMNAVTWCLYGREKHRDSKEKDLPTINTEALRENSHGVVRMKVLLKLADNDGDKFAIERSLALYTDGDVDHIKYDKTTEMVIPITSTPTITKNFQLYDKDSKSWDTTYYFDKSVKDLLPEDLATYFLFDGEKLEDFFEQTDNTRKGIEDVSQIKVTEQAIETLAKFVSQLRKNFKSLDPKVTEYQHKLADAENDVEKCKKKIATLLSGLREKDDERTGIESHLLKVGGDIGNYQKQATEAKEALDRSQKLYDESKSKKRDYVLEHALAIHMLDAVADTVRDIKAKGDEGVLPPKIQEPFVRDLLAKGTCICGGDISHGNPSRGRIMKHLNQARYSQISDICTELKFKLEPMLWPDGVRKELDAIDRGLIYNERQRKDCKDRLDDWEAKIGNTDVQAVKQLADRKLLLNAEIGRINQDLGIARHGKKQYEGNCAEYETRLDKEFRKDSSQRYLKRKIDFCQVALGELRKVRDSLLDSVQETVKKYTKEYFLKFLWKKDTYEDVSIDEDYRMTARHVHGYDVLMGLSKGEKLILALSFMAALRKITGFGFPLLIDTPLGRVSGEPRHNIAVTLPSIMGDNQVTLLVTDSEYQSPIHDDEKRQVFPSVRDTISRHVGADYDIVFSGGKAEVKLL